ncbi:Six-bladed beta-propeller TolB-like protein [Botryosphaeria dothidea]|uniref:Eukaryotic translation initiation factor 2A n=1 Tax=Botryosphaeria dothidea TaxID=55169 RepID=A0A8H4ISY9_9PEZI|nr:Six-bladed beta-propeller TolB-like protein [Botryosphaeria dothidea]
MAQQTQLAYRTLKGIGVFNAAPVYDDLPGFNKPEGNLRCCCYSPDGKYFAWASPEQVFVIDAATGNVVTTLPAENVFELGFSPLGTYIITWQRPTKDETGNATKNLKVWRTIDDNAGAEGQRGVVGQFVQKNQTGWNLQYTSDERFCGRCVTNEVQFYQSDDLSTVWNKLRVEGVTDFAVSPGKNHSVAVFVPERKGQPASVKVFLVPQFASPVSQKTFFKGDKVQMKWNNLGTSVIVLAQTDVDKTNKSYYGETNMYILSANGGFDARITLDKEGPIHDVTWSPNSKEFGVVYGYMPAKATIFNQRAVATHNFPLGPRNTILFSPHGRFVLVAGFGNLAGQMDIYDLEKDYAKVCTIEAANSSICEWSPDGKHIMTATTSPRLRVDNGIRIYHVTGGLQYFTEFSELYHVTWRPQSTAEHPLDNPLGSIPTPHESATKYLATVKAPTKPAGAYRPPGARGTSTPLHFKREDEGGAAFVNTGISSTSGNTNGNTFGRARRQVPGAEEHVPPGAAPGGGVSLAGTGEGADDGLSKAALKNKKKREAKKAKEAAEKAAGLGTEQPKGNGVSPDRKGRSHSRNRSRNSPDGRAPSQNRRNNYNNGPQQGQHHRNVHSQGGQNGQRYNGPPIQTQQPAPQQQQPAAPAAAPEVMVTSPGGVSPQDKKIRSLMKKLRAIDDLKMRQAGGEKLEDTQVKKIHTEESIRKELEGLGFHG